MLSTYRIPGKLPNEEVVHIIRRDMFVLLVKIFFSAVLVVLPALLFYVLVNFIYPYILENYIAYTILVLCTSFYYLFVWLFSFFSFIDYYLDIWIITNERIIDVQQKGFFARTISEQRLYRIQDVTSDMTGFLPTVFKFGDVHVQTAGAKTRFYFHQVPNPDDVRNEIISLAERSKRKHIVDNV